MLNRLEMLRIDTYNKQICQIAPAIKEHGIEHERNKFQVMKTLTFYKFLLNFERFWVYIGEA